MIQEARKRTNTERQECSTELDNILSSSKEESNISQSKLVHSTSPDQPDDPVDSSSKLTIKDGKSKKVESSKKSSLDTSEEKAVVEVGEEAEVEEVNVETQEETSEFSEIYEVHNIDTLRKTASKTIPFEYEPLQIGYAYKAQLLAFSPEVLEAYFPSLYEALLPKVKGFKKVVIKVYDKQLMRECFHRKFPNNKDWWFKYGSREYAFEYMDNCFETEVSSYIKIKRANDRIEDEEEKVKCPQLLHYGDSLTLEFPNILEFPDKEHQFEWFNYPYVRMQGKYIITEYLDHKPVTNVTKFIKQGKKQLKILAKSARLTHGSIATRNVRNVNGQFYFIDFERSKDLKKGYHDPCFDDLHALERVEEKLINREI